MTDIMPSSILELAQTVSQGTDEIITVIMSQNTGSSRRYALFDPLGGFPNNLVLRVIQPTGIGVVNGHAVAEPAQ